VKTSARILRHTKRGCIVALVIGLAGSVTRARAPEVLSDQQLIALAQDTYNRSDWLYAALHMNALVQRNIPSVRDNPAVAESIESGLKFAIQQLDEDRRLAAQWRQQAATKGPGVSGTSPGISSGLSNRPRVIWPTGGGD
jgi:hypothetical protein